MADKRYKSPFVLLFHNSVVIAKTNDASFRLKLATLLANVLSKKVNKVNVAIYCLVFFSHLLLKLKLVRR